METRCSIEGCDRPRSARGWCGAHYQRWYAHGDPLVCFLPMATRGVPMRYYRETVLTYRGDDCLTWPFATTPNGYGQIRLDGRMQSVHRLACCHVNGPAPTPKHEAAHNCGNGNKGCCNPRHLSWKTHAENMADIPIHNATREAGAANGPGGKARHEPRNDHPTQ